MTWLSDAVAVALITAFFGFLSAKSQALSKKQMDTIGHQLTNLSDKINDVQCDVSEVKTIGNENRNGIRYTQRYRLFVDMQAEIKRGYTTLEKVREIGQLFESYVSLGGNGAVHDLHELYLKLPVKSEE